MGRAGLERRLQTHLTILLLRLLHGSLDLVLPNLFVGQHLVDGKLQRRQHVRHALKQRQRKQIHEPDLRFA